MRAAYLAVAALVPAAWGCTDDTDPPWQLDHDRIIAVRATPPRIAAGAQAVLDGLIGGKGVPVAERAPDDATVVSPASLAAAISHGAAGWVITAPSREALATARAGLGLPVDAPVPLELRVAYAGLVATKTVWLGDAADNPEMTGIEVDHAGAPAGSLVVAPRQDIPLSVGLDAASFDVAWLSSCGTVHDFDLPTAYLRVEAGDRSSGELALVVRDRGGGVSWRVWSIDARQASPGPQSASWEPIGGPSGGGAGGSARRLGSF